MIPRLAVISVWAEDVQEAAHFYRDLIGLSLIPLHSDRPHFDLGGCYMVILQGRPTTALNMVPARFPIVAFNVDSLDEAIGRLRSKGIELPYGVEEDTHARWVMFHDPAGNLIELVEFLV